MYEHTNFILKKYCFTITAVNNQVQLQWANSVLMFLKDFNTILLKISLKSHLTGTFGFFVMLSLKYIFQVWLSELTTVLVLPDTKIQL